MPSLSPRSLYICYFGLREPLVQTQVLPYLRQLVRAGVEMHLLTFEPQSPRLWNDKSEAEWRGDLTRDGIHWHSLPYHQRPTLPATLFDIAMGAWTVRRLVKQYQIHIIHARSHVAAAMGAIAKWRSGAKLIFDIRGFMAEEYVDAGHWPANGLLYRWTKRAERLLLQCADGFVVLTQRAKDVLFPGCEDTDDHGRPIEIIPCCVDLQRFEGASGIKRENIRKELGTTGRRVIVYIGALGGWYLTQEMTDFVAVARQRDATTFFIVLTQSLPDRLLQALEKASISSSDFLLRKVHPEDIGNYLAAADVALSFVKPCYSKLSSSPTKIAEYLAAGIPVVSTAGIGDIDQVLMDHKVGAIIAQLEFESYERTLDEIECLQQDPALSDRCRSVARQEFDLRTVGGPRYKRLYERVCAKS